MGRNGRTVDSVTKSKVQKVMKGRSDLPISMLCFLLYDSSISKFIFKPASVISAEANRSRVKGLYT